MVKLYKCPQCEAKLHPLRLPKFEGGGRTYRGWSGVWYCRDCHALVVLADELHDAPIFIYPSKDWLEK